MQYKDELAQDLLELALRWNFSGYTQDWEWLLTGSGFHWAGYNTSMTHVSAVLRQHDLGLGNSISTDLDFVNFAHGSAPDCCPSYRNQEWASVLNDMGTCEWHKAPLPCNHADIERENTHTCRTHTHTYSLCKVPCHPTIHKYDHADRTSDTVVPLLHC